MYKRQLKPFLPLVISIAVIASLDRLIFEDMIGDYQTVEGEDAWITAVTRASGVLLGEQDTLTFRVEANRYRLARAIYDGANPLKGLVGKEWLLADIELDKQTTLRFQEVVEEEFENNVRQLMEGSITSEEVYDCLLYTSPSPRD